jgi:hypothetical protein
MPFEVVAVDGLSFEDGARYQADAVNVGPGQRYARGTKIESTVRYLGIEVDDALAIADQVDV